MKYDPNIHLRRSIRLPDYDYTAPGFYFVTICVQGRKSLLGDIVDGVVTLNDAGRMVDLWWNEMSNKFATVELDHYIIMPNHFHGIITLHHPDAAVGANLCVRPGLDPDSVGADHRVFPDLKPEPRAGNDSDGLRVTGHPQESGGHADPEEKGGHADPEEKGGHIGPKEKGGHIGPKEKGGHIGPPLPTVVQWFKTMSTNAYIQGVNNHNWPPFPGKLWQRNYYEWIIRDDNELHYIRRYIRDNPAQWDTDNENPTNQPMAIDP